MLMAGALGYDFLPVMKSVKESDVFKIRTFRCENKMKTIKSPFSGEETVVVPALNPDVAIVHVQRADKYGNAQLWGSEGTVKWAALSAKKIIVTCEEIVEHEKIRRSPFLTIIHVKKQVYLAVHQLYFLNMVFLVLRMTRKRCTYPQYSLKQR